MKILIDTSPTTIQADPPSDIPGPTLTDAALNYNPEYTVQLSAGCLHLRVGRHETVFGPGETWALYEFLAGAEVDR